MPILGYKHKLGADLFLALQMILVGNHLHVVVDTTCCLLLLFTPLFSLTQQCVFLSARGRHFSLHKVQLFPGREGGKFGGHKREIFCVKLEVSKFSSSLV